MTKETRKNDSIKKDALNKGLVFGLSIGLISTIFVIRLVTDTSFRMFYPFVPQISEGLGLNITVFSWLLSIRASAGLLSPIFGVLADRYGRRVVMTSALIAQGLGLLGVASTTGWLSLVPMFVTGLATAAFFPAQQAYISDQVPYERRGRALASFEISFAVSGILILPLVGWILDSWGWQVPFILLGVLSLLGSLAIWSQLPKSETRTGTNVIHQATWAVIKKKGVLASIGVAVFLFISVSIFMTFWGIWLSEDFGFGALELGLMATIIGFGELTGSLGSSIFIDRIGKRRGVMAGLFLGIILFLLIPLIGRSTLGIRIILIATITCLEFSIVSLFPLYGEQAPGSCATVFSLVALGTSIGLAAGPSLVTSLWAWNGLVSITRVGAISLLVAFILVGMFLFDQKEDGSSGV